VERGRRSSEQAAMGQERAVAGDQRDVRVDRPRPQTLHVLLVGTRGQAHLRRYRFRWTEWRLSNKIHHHPGSIAIRDPRVLVEFGSTLTSTGGRSLSVARDNSRDVS